MWRVTTLNPNPNTQRQQRVGSVVRVPKMAELVASDLRRQIIRGEIAEGASLPSEPLLMEAYGVSRPTLREALRVLESERLIIIRRGARGGAEAQTPRREVAARYAGLILEHQGTTLLDVYRARAAIESACVQELAASRTASDLKALRTALAESNVAVAPSDSIRVHSDFHAVMVRLAGNDTLVLLHEMLHCIISVADRSLRPDVGASAERARRKSGRTHDIVVQYIEAGNVEAAHELWTRHLVEAEEYLLDGDESLTVLDLLH